MENRPFQGRKFLPTLVFVFIGIILLIILSSSTFLTIDAGERGVIFRPFSTGLDKENIYTPGFHIVAPWNTMFVYNVQENQLEETMEILSSNGLNIKVDVTVRVNPVYDKIGYLHETFGKDYVNTLVRPEVRSAVRQVLGRFQPEELYSSRREEVQSMIHKDIEANLGKNFVELKATLIRDISLPDKVKNAIEEKIEAEQLALKYVYILQQERKEAERKIIEANAKSESNKILNASLTDKILKDKGIEATLQLANSANTKVIVVGGNGDGLPLILGGN
ncbi:MAG: prohibitin family protein [Saprospiraceae bacterium]|nr:MAG: prohibitin family protein [Saprospiraceae bacterium]